MPYLLALCLLVCLSLLSPASVLAKTPPPPSDLEVVISDLKENIKDLQHNIASWRKIQWDSNLTPDQKKTWRQKAQDYLQECQDYKALLDRVNADKLPKSDAGRRFLLEKENFQKELQVLQEVLQQP